METIIQRACGLDVHQASLTACIMRQGIERQIKTFGTTTPELLELKHWLIENRITHIAMERTRVYRKPVFNVLTAEDWQLLLVNARHIKNVPGRKTDTQDSEWICKLLRAGLLKSSFIPPEDIRQLRELTRYRKKLQQQVQNEKNRAHKILQEAKQQALEPLTGRFIPHHQFMLQTVLQHIRFLEQQLQKVEQQSEQYLQQYTQQVEQLSTIPYGQKESATMMYQKSFLLNPGNEEGKKAMGIIKNSQVE